jgi:hypothetical protein
MSLRKSFDAVNGAMSRRAVGAALAGAAAGFAGAAALTRHDGGTARSAGPLINAQLMSYPTGTQNVGSLYWLPPSGDTTGATDVANINGLLSAGNAVFLTPGGSYYISSPILPVTGSRLDGGQWWSAVDSDIYTTGGEVGQTGGALITMTSTFSGDAAISLPDPGSAATNQQWGVDISGLTIEGHSLTSGSAYGIHVTGAWGACYLRGVCVHRPPQDCVRFDVGTDDSIPDDWYIEGCKFSGSRDGYGCYASHLDDSWILSTESSENALDGWYFGYGVNTRFVGCKGENNGGNGYQFTGLYETQTVVVNGCTTHLNKQNGFLFSNAGGGGLGTYLLTGCLSQQDGQTSGSGYTSDGCVSRVIATGCHVDVNTTGPKYGAAETSSSYGKCFTGCRLQGVTAATHDDGSNTHALVNQSPVPF